MKSLGMAYLAITTVCYGAAVNGQVKPREPHIGYLYPSGGRQNSTFQVIIGGSESRGRSTSMSQGMVYMGRSFNLTSR